MENLIEKSLKKSLIKPIIFLILFLGIQHIGYSSNLIETDTIGFNRYKGKVIDSKTKKPLIFASLNVNESNISTVTNSQGEFLLKVPKKLYNKTITISFLGYTSSVYKLTDLNEKVNIIKLDTHIEELSEVNIVTKDALSIVKQMLKQKQHNYFDTHTNMTAFYRETIQKRKSYVSLSEAVVDINKQPYMNNKRDILQLYKSRKNTDYKKLDTVAFKLSGGPFNTLYMDIMKYDLFQEGFENEYHFTFGKSTKIDNRPIYVINFKQNKLIKDPLFYGKLYIDAQTLALTSAKFYLNMNNINKARKIFIIKKPKNAIVTPIKAEYKIDYRVRNGKWYYGYSRIELGFKVNWDKKWFNTIYNTTMEMAITDWKTLSEKPTIKYKERLKKSVIMSDEASGFSDPDFWGTYNVIEPEKPIESAIKKIQKQLKRKKQD
ncbi:carboxypeptidase-like regulatory domain-containing protein [Lutibacter sp. TH_r2]|uniref:carboxypeptidase-like regulatory domain-containing protein n=1 Tax=Lutibacter sp. TH_r2 TaxID=3082083 RepID=UPI0029551FB6|nr:carboxypeptidase-like regulatory domain-containing protein [Lutibacter sp. TH_r2]MDV7186027.1 carboxypeptidase-like regulatory domain-containing protein [Lutibacter sp. TH_r2]